MTFNENEKLEPLSEEELTNRMSMAIQDAMQLAAVCYNRKTHEFESEKVQNMVDFYEEKYAKQRVSFTSIWESLLSLDNIAELIEIMIKKGSTLRPATKEEIEEIEKETNKDGNKEESN